MNFEKLKEKFLKNQKGISVSPALISGVLTLLIFAFIIMKLLPVLLPDVVVASHNFSDEMETASDTVGESDVGDIFAQTDTFFLYSLVAGAIGLVITIGLVVFNVAKSRFGGGGRRYNRGYRGRRY